MCGPSLFKFMSQGRCCSIKPLCQLEDDTNYEFYLEWLPLFCADLPYISEIKAIWVIRIQNTLGTGGSRDIIYVEAREHTHVHTHTHAMCTCAGMHSNTTITCVMFVRSDEDVLMKLHDECGPLCRAKTKLEVEDIMTHTMPKTLQPLDGHDAGVGIGWRRKTNGTFVPQSST